jgi:two-component sensor histidine kinase
MSGTNVTYRSASGAAVASSRQIKFVITALAVAIATIIELPEFFDAPGKPFLLYFIVSALCTLAFGYRFGLFAMGASSVLSVLFFDPVYTFWLSYQKDLIDIIAFALIGSVSVLGLARIKAEIATHVRVREQQASRIMLSEMAHRVANNFAAAVAILGRASRIVLDTDAKRALGDALNQLHIFASVHHQLRPDSDGNLCVDCKEFIGGLCSALEKAAVNTAHLRFCPSNISLALQLSQAVALGLIINELVANSIKYAFPDGRTGRIDVTVKVHGKECHVCVADNGVGKSGRAKGGGRGLGLVEGLTQQLGGSFRMETSLEGTRGKICFPLQRKQIHACEGS